MSFDLSNYSLKISKSTKTPTSKVRVQLKMCGFIPSHSCDYWVAFPARTFPCFYFRHKPKGKVMTIFLFSMYDYNATLFSYHTFHTFINYVETFQNKNFNSFHNSISSNLHLYKNLFLSNEGVSKGPKILIYVLAKMKLNKKIHKILHITFTMWFIMHINLCKKLSSGSPSLNHAY